MFPVDITKFLKIVFLCNTSGGCLWQPYHGTVKSAGVPVLWFCASTCFRFWSKTFTKRRINNSLLTHDKIIYSLLELIAHILSIAECFEKTLIAFDFDEKITQSFAQVCLISCVKRISSPALCGLSGALDFRVWFWKRDTAVKTPILTLFRFCLLCWLKNHLFCVLFLLQLQVVLII